MLEVNSQKTKRGVDGRKMQKKLAQELFGSELKGSRSLGIKVQKFESSGRQKKRKREGGKGGDWGGYSLRAGRRMNRSGTRLERKQRYGPRGKRWGKVFGVKESEKKNYLGGESR